jgi:signal peptide peptidase SppA
MQTFQLLSHILKGKWAIDPFFAIRQGPVVASLLNRQTELGLGIISDTTEGNPKYYAVKPGTILSEKFNYINGFGSAPENSVAVIEIKGALMKDDLLCGPDGMSTIGRIIKEADINPNIIGILLNIDSPGGTVDGTETLANIVKSTSKPTLTYIDGLMASAALWIGTSADEIWASTDTDEVGSVGVLLSFADMQPMWEKKGAVFHTITASTSNEKVKLWEDLRKCEYEEYIKTVLDPIDQKFMEVVKTNRPAAEEKHLTGKVFFARDVLGVFVDRIGTLDQAILRVAELAENASAETEDLNDHNIREMKQFMQINEVLGVESLESSEEGVYLNEEQLQEIETRISANTALTTERDNERDLREAAEASRTGAETALNEALSLFNEIDPTVASAQTAEEKANAVRVLLASRVGAKPAGVETKEDPDLTTQGDIDWKKINSLPHNQNVE